MRKFALALALLLAPALAFAQVPQAPPLTTAPTLSASSGNVAAATATATIAAIDGQTNYLCGFAITSSGSTAAAVVSVTVTGLLGGTQTYTYTSVAGVTLANAPLVVQFPACVQASGQNVAIAVSMPTLGAGNTNASVNAFGFRFDN